MEQQDFYQQRIERIERIENFLTDALTTTKKTAEALGLLYKTGDGLCENLAKIDTIQQSYGALICDFFSNLYHRLNKCADEKTSRLETLLRKGSTRFPLSGEPVERSDSSVEVFTETISIVYSLSSELEYMHRNYKTLTALLADSDTLKCPEMTAEELAKNYSRATETIKFIISEDLMSLRPLYDIAQEAYILKNQKLFEEAKEAVANVSQRVSLYLSVSPDFFDLTEEAKNRFIERDCFKGGGYSWRIEDQKRVRNSREIAIQEMFNVYRFMQNLENHVNNSPTPPVT